MTIQGLHHITLVTTDALRNVDFYTRVLGQRLVKKTVNFDDPGSYHLYYGDEIGRPGTAITFFEWRDVPRGRPGIGGTHHFAMTVDDRDGLLKWKRRLTDLGLAVTGPVDKRYFMSISFNDPDGTILEIATQGPGFARNNNPISAKAGGRNHDESRSTADTWPEPVPIITPDMALSQGMHHITAISSDIERTHAFFGELLGMQRVKATTDFENPGLAHWYWGVDDGRPGTLLTYLEHDPSKGNRARMGAGQTHHFALSVPDEDTQLEWREQLMQAGLRVSPVMDRVYFKSIYTSDPDGHIVELATAGPGFLVDEDVEDLGRSLQLPPWLEKYRSQIEPALGPVTTSTGMLFEVVS